MLLEYFGEIDAPSCGICDVCKSLEKLRLSAFEFETFGKEIISTFLRSMLQGTGTRITLRG